MILDRVPGPFRLSRSGVVDRVFSFRAGMFWSDHRLAGRAIERPTLLDAFESALHQLFVREARGYQFVTAGCVGWRGRAIVVPGLSRAQTSALVHALVERGAAYYSDAFAVFDRRGRVHAFRAPHERRAPLPLGFVVQPSFDAGTERPPRRLTPAETVRALVPHAARASAEPAMVTSVLARSAAGAIGIETSRSDAAAAAWILEQLDS